MLHTVLVGPHNSFEMGLLKTVGRDAGCFRERPVEREIPRYA